MSPLPSLTVLASPTIANLAVPTIAIPEVIFDGRASVNFLRRTQLPKPLLDATAIRRVLPPAPRLARDALLEIIRDESASVRDGNDVVGLRNQILYVALAHLAARRGPGAWQAQISTFDLNSPQDLPRTRLDKAGLNQARRALTTPNTGGCSILGPSIQRATLRIANFGGPTLLVVLSDFELFDADPSGALAQLRNAPSSETVAISLTNDPPSVLVGSRIHAVRIRSGDEVSSLARVLVEAAQRCASRPLGDEQ